MDDAMNRATETYQNQPVLTEGSERRRSDTFRVYKKRWLLLLLLCLLQITNAMNWICFAPKSDLITSYFQVDSIYIDMLSLVYMILFPVAIPTNYAMQKWGLRFALLGGSVVNAFGVCFRLLYFVVPSSYGFWMVLVGQSIAALTQPAFMLSATVLAATWFSESERTAANSIASMSNLLGILIANGLTLWILHIPSDTKTLLISFSVPTLVPLIFAVILLFKRGSDVPPLPPSPSAALFRREDGQNSTAVQSRTDISNTSTSREEPQTGQVQTDLDASSSTQLAVFENEAVPFHRGARAALRSVPFCLLAWSIGVGFGVFNSLLTVNAQVFCARGYANWLAPVVACTMIGSGFIGALLVGWLVDSANRAALDNAKREGSATDCWLLRVRIDEVYTLLLALTSVIFIGFALLTAYPNNELTLLLICGFFGFLAFPLFPLALEIGVECTFPKVSEATSSTLLIAGGQIHGVVYVLLSTSVLSSPLSDAQAALSTCASSDPPLDFMPFSVFLYSIVGATSVLFMLLFRTELKRTEFDRRCRLNQLTQPTLPSHQNTSTIST